MRAQKPVVETKKAATEVEVKWQPFKLETLSESTGEFSGTAITFDTLHDTSSWMLGGDWQDRMKPGAFDETLSVHAKNGTLPLMLTGHERMNIPGVWTSVKTSKTGLEVKGKVSPSAITKSGVPLLELMKMGAIRGLSIGFRATEVTLDEKAKIRDINVVELAEISIVDLAGAGPTAKITDVKRDPRGFEAGLRSLGLSKREAKALMAGGFSAMGKEEPEPAPEPVETEELAATKVSRQAQASSDKAEQLSAAAEEAHGTATVAHAAAAAGHIAAAHDHSRASKQAADKGDDVGAAEFKASADAHTERAGRHHAAASGMQAYQTKAAPAAPGPIQVESDGIKDSLSLPDADGTRPDAAEQDAAAIRELAHTIQNLLE
jgi:uncharacterized protein